MIRQKITSKQRELRLAGEMMHIKKILLPFLTLFLLTPTFAVVPKEHKGVCAGGGLTYNLMTAEWYSLNQNIKDAGGALIEAGYKMGGPIRVGLRYWASSHSMQSSLFSANRFLFQGIEGVGQVILLRRKRVRPFFLLGYAELSLRKNNGEGYTGFGYSFAVGAEYWLRDHLTLSSEFDVRYVDFTGAQIGTLRFTSGGAVNATMLSFQFLKLTWQY